MEYSALAAVYRELGGTSKRLEKTRIIADFLKDAPDEDLDRALLLLQGRVFPRWDRRTLGVSSRLAVKAIARTSGASEKEVKERWKREGDLGLVAESLLGSSQQSTLFSSSLSLKDVVEKLRSLSSMEGSGSVSRKLGTIAGLLSSAEPSSVRYLLGTLLEELRVGVAEGIIRDSIVWAYLDPPIEDGQVQDQDEYKRLVEAVQAAYDRCSDYGTVARAAKKGLQELSTITFSLGRPIRVMLAQRETSVSSAFDRVGRPAAFEYKYDGFRLQVHKDGDDVTLFTRRLEDVTAQFPDVVAAVREGVSAERCLLDGEAVGYDASSGAYTPFQAVSQRIRRKYDIERLAERLPVELCVFDILYDGSEVLDEPFKERRRLLEKYVNHMEKKVRPSKLLVTEDDAEAERFYKDALAAGNEGLMAKNLDGVYKPGSRVGHMVKIKPTLDTMDLVVVGAEWGEGKRSGWLTSFTLACADSDGERFLTVGKVGTGLKELETEGAVTFEGLTKELQDSIVEESGREVRVHPSVVLEIRFEEVQRSPTYEAGYALRFPRVVQVRDDRGPEDVSTIDEVEAAYRVQRQ